MVDNGTDILLYLMVKGTHRPPSHPGGSWVGQMQTLAVSRDGIGAFTKPALGVGLCNGSRANNSKSQPLFGLLETKPK